MNPIVEFQKSKGLVADGSIGKKTLAAIKADCNIKSDIELAHFVGQCHHETGGFTASSENLNYSADGLLKIFPKYFPDLLTAKKYERKPQLIASRVYANRMGNGSEELQDGWKYIGRGAIQLTGKDNYKLFGISINDTEVLTNPDVVASKYFFRSADFFFDRNNLWVIANKGITDEIITQLTKRINGGTHGLSDRIKQTKHYHSILTA
jgi:putative chitinase